MRSFYRCCAVVALSVVVTAAAHAASDNQPDPVILNIPIELTNPDLQAGCWAQFYSKREFKGDMLTLVGSSSLESLDKGLARKLKRTIDSIVVGPKAKLTVYEHAMFKDRSVIFEANSREGGLIKKLGVGGQINSLSLECS